MYISGWVAEELTNVARADDTDVMYCTIWYDHDDDSSISSDSNGNSIDDNTNNRDSDSNKSNSVARADR